MLKSNLVASFFPCLFDDDDATTDGRVFTFATNANEHDDAVFASSWDACNHALYDARPDRTRSSGSSPVHCRTSSSGSSPVSICSASTSWSTFGSRRTVVSGRSPTHVGFILGSRRLVCRSQRKTPRKKKRQSLFSISKSVSISVFSPTPSS